MGCGKKRGNKDKFKWFGKSNWKERVIIFLDEKFRGREDWLGGWGKNLGV